MTRSRTRGSSRGMGKRGMVGDRIGRAGGMRKRGGGMMADAGEEMFRRG